MILYALVFIVMAINDWVWSRYIAEVGAKRAARAAVWGSLTLLFGAFNVVSYTHDHWAVVPAVAGAFVGTYVAVKRSK